MIARIALAAGLVALWPKPVGVAIALAAYAFSPRLMALLESDQVRQRRLGIDHEVPLLAELLSAHLIAGAGLLEAVESIASSLTSPLAALTCDVAQRLRAGDPAPFEPWASVPALKSLADSCQRAVRTGASIAAVANRVALRMRAEQHHQRQAQLERAVVRMTLPLGLCLLPAFVLTVVIPMAYSLFQAADF